MEKLVIDRSRWIYGAKPAWGGLRDQDGNMCCLGFEAIRLGVLPAALEKQTTPRTVPALMNTWLVAGQQDSPQARLAMEINDNENMPNREQALIELFAQQGVELSFEQSSN